MLASMSLGSSVLSLAPPLFSSKSCHFCLTLLACLYRPSVSTFVLFICLEEEWQHQPQGPLEKISSQLLHGVHLGIEIQWPKAPRSHGKARALPSWNPHLSLLGRGKLSERSGSKPYAPKARRIASSSSGRVSATSLPEFVHGLLVLVVVVWLL